MVFSNYLFLDSTLVGCDSNLVGMFLETCPFLLGCQICWHIIVYSIPYGLYYYCDISFYVSFLISCFFGFSLFLVSLARGLSILFTFSKNELLVLLFFFSIFLTTILFISSLILIISFCWFYVLFSTSSGRLGFFLVLMRKACIAINFPLRTAFATSQRFCMVVFSLSSFSR